MLLWTGIGHAFSEWKELITNYKVDRICCKQWSKVFVASLRIWPQHRTGMTRTCAVTQLVHGLLSPFRSNRLWAPVLSSNVFCNQKLQASEDSRQEQAQTRYELLWAGTKLDICLTTPHTVWRSLSFPASESWDLLLDLGEFQVQSGWVWCSTSSRMLKTPHTTCRS